MTGLSQENLMKEVSFSIAKHNGLLEKAKQLESELNVLAKNKADGPTHGLPNGLEHKYRPTVNNTSPSPKRPVAPRRKSDSKSRGGGRPGGQGSLGMDNFDAHIKSIITNALMADQSVDKSRGERTTGAHSGSVTVVKELDAKVHVTDYSKKDRVGQPNKTLVSEVTGKHSLPVSIPLKELSEVHTKHQRDATRDTYSPITISRPSSSSSTMSADSVKNLPNGASDCLNLSPPYSIPIMHNPISSNRKGDPVFIDPRIQASIQASLALGYRSPYLPVHARDSPHGQPGAPMFNTQGNAIDNFLHNTHGRDKYSHPAGLNGFNRLTPPHSKTTPSPVKSTSPAVSTTPPSGPGKGMSAMPEDRGRRWRKKRTYSGGRSPPSAVKRQAGGRVTNEVAAMVSVASQPLAISSISDAESSTKSSPGLGTSPTKIPPHMLPDGKNNI